MRPAANFTASSINLSAELARYPQISQTRQFSLADVDQVKAEARNGEFFVAVFAGITNTKMYKVKRKFQTKLGLQ